jgi:hypothetical protein
MGKFQNSDQLTTKLTTEHGLAVGFSYNDVELLAAHIQQESNGMFQKVPTTAELLEETMAYGGRESIIVSDDWNDDTTKILSFQLMGSKFGPIYDAIVHKLPIMHKKHDWTDMTVQMITKVVESDDWICTIRNISRAAKSRYKTDQKIVFIPKSELTKLGLEDYEAMCTEEESSCSDDEEDNEEKQLEQSDDDDSMF